MPGSSGRYRTLSAAELQFCVNWAAEVGWNPGLEDALAFYGTDPEGFFVAEVDGLPVAAMTVVNHAPDFAFLGAYVCRPEYRGRGIAYGLWQHGLRHAGGRIVGVDSLPELEDSYRHSGFVRTGETLRFTGQVPGRASPRVRPVAEADVPRLARIETAACGYPKPVFLPLWFTDTATRHTLVLDDGEGPAGMVTVRQCVEGHRIGPLVAPDIGGAIALLHAAGEIAGGVTGIDLPDDQSLLIGYCQSLGMENTGQTARMYRGPAPRPGRALRAVATIEVG